MVILKRFIGFILRSAVSLVAWCLLFTQFNSFSATGNCASSNSKIPWIKTQVSCGGSKDADSVVTQLRTRLMVKKFVDPQKQEASQHVAIWGDSAGSIYRSFVNIAGDGSNSINDEVPATQTGIVSVVSIIGDTIGNIFYVDQAAHIIRKIDAGTGIVRTIAGIANSAGDSFSEGSASTASHLNYPFLLWIDVDSNLYVTNSGTSTVLRLAYVQENYYQTHYFAGRGGSLEEYVPAITASLPTPTGMCGDSQGNIYISLQDGQNKILKIDPITGLISTVIGGGRIRTKEDYDANGVILDEPSCIWIDSVGNLYFVDGIQIKKWNHATNIVSHVVNRSGNTGHDDDLNASDSYFKRPLQLWGNSIGILFISDAEEGRIRMVDLNSHDEFTYTDFRYGDERQRGSAISNEIYNLWSDSLGNLFFIDPKSCSVRKVDSVSGSIVLIGGTGVCDENGPLEGQPFNSSVMSPYLRSFVGDDTGRFYYAMDNGYFKVIMKEYNNYVKSPFEHRLTDSPYSHSVMSCLPDGSVLVLFQDDHKAKRVFPLQRKVKEYAGLGYPGYSGDNGPALEAKFNYPQGMWANSNGVAFIADTNNNRIRVIYRVGGIEVIDTLAGMDDAGWVDDVTASTALFTSPTSIVGDSIGNLFVADSGNHRIRMIYLNMIEDQYYVTTIAGNGNGDNANPPLLLATDTHALSVPAINPQSIWLDSNHNLYYLEYTQSSQFLLRKGGLSDLPSPPTMVSDVIDKLGSDHFMVGKVVGYGSNPAPPSINVNVIWGDSVGNIYAALSDNRIRKVSNNGKTTTLLAGDGSNGIIEGVPATESGLNSVTWITGDTNGNVFFVDYMAHIIRTVRANDSTIHTVAGKPYSPGYSSNGCGPARSCHLYYPLSMLLDANNNMYITQGTRQIYFLPFDGVGKWTQISFFAGGGSYADDGTEATNFYFYSVGAIVSDNQGNIYVADNGRPALYRIDVERKVWRVIGGGGYGDDDGVQGTNAYFSGGNVLAINPSGNLFYPESNKVKTFNTSSNSICWIAGDGNSGFREDGNSLAASFYGITSLWVDSNGNLYIADSDNGRIRKYDVSQGTVLTFTDFLYGDGGPAEDGILYKPRNLWGDSMGNLYYVETEICSVRKVDGLTGTLTTFGGNAYCAGGENNGLPFYNSKLSTYLRSFWGSSSPDMYYLLDNTVLKVVDPSENYNLVVYGDSLTPSSDAEASICGTTYGTILVVVPSESVVKEYSPNNQTVETIAGVDSTSGYNGDQVPATAAYLNSPRGVWMDDQKNIYIADTDNHRIRRISATNGIISTFAGTGDAGFSDEGNATNCMLNAPFAIVGDSKGNFFIADYSNYRIRMIYWNEGKSNYWMRSIIGDGNAFDPSNGFSRPKSAYSAIGNPTSVWVDNEYNVYFIERCETQSGTEQFAIRKGFYIDDLPTNYPSAAPTQRVFDAKNEPFVGGVYQNDPGSLAVWTVWGDSLGNIYMGIDYRFIRRFNIVDESVEIIAGSQSWTPYADGRLANETYIGQLSKIWGDEAGNLFYVDRAYNMVVRIDAVTQRVSSVGPVNQPSFIWGNTAGQLYISEAGGTWSSSCVREIDLNHMEQYPNGTMLICDLQYPTGVWADSAGLVYVISQGDGSMWRANSTLQQQVVGWPRSVNPTDDDHSLGKYQLSGANGIWVDSNGKVYLCDNQRVIYYDPTTDEARPLTGANTSWNSARGDGGPAVNASVNYPNDVWGDSEGNIFIADTQNSMIRMVDANRTMHTIADFRNGNGGPATAASIGNVMGMYGDSLGNLYYVDQSYCVIRKTNTNGIISTIAGNYQCNAATSGDGYNAKVSSFNSYLGGFWIDSNGASFFHDRRSIRRIDPVTNIVSTFYRNLLDNFYTNIDLVGDTLGNLYVTSPNENIIRRVSANDTSWTVYAGIRYYSGNPTENVQATQSRLSYPTGLWIDSSRNLFIADQYNNRIRRVAANGIITTIAGNGFCCSYNPMNGDATSLSLYYPNKVTGDTSGNLYVSDYYHYAVHMISPQGSKYVYRSVIGGYNSWVYGYPNHLWVNNADGALYVAFSSPWVIYKAISLREVNVSPTEQPTISTLTLQGSPYVSSPQHTSQSYQIRTIWGDSNGDLYCDVNGKFIRKVARSGAVIDTVAGIGQTAPTVGLSGRKIRK